MSSCLTQWRYFRNILRSHPVTVTPSSPTHTPSLQRPWKLLCMDHHGAAQTVLFGNHSPKWQMQWMIIHSWSSTFAHAHGEVRSSHLLSLLLSQPPVQLDMLGGWGVTGKARPSFKWFKRIQSQNAEQAVLPTNLGTAPSATLILHLTQPCYKPGSLMSRAGISGNSHTVPCPTTLPTSLCRSNREIKQFRRAASFGHWENSLSRVLLPPATGWSRNLTPWLSYIP